MGCPEKLGQYIISGASTPPHLRVKVTTFGEPGQGVLHEVEVPNLDPRSVESIRPPLLRDTM